MKQTRSKQMSLKKLGVALLAVFVLGAIAANSAFAAAEWRAPGGQWYTGASPGTKLVGSKALTTTAVGTQELATTVGTTPVVLKATGVNCIGCTIQNPTTTTATATGKLEFTTVTVSEPAGCSVPGGTVTTNALTAVLGMKNGSATIATVQFKPTSGATFAVVTLEGISCPIASTFKVTGEQYAQANNATGVFGASQGITVTKAIQENASGITNALKFGENAAVLTGALTASIGGTEWAGKES
jgi:hypothetical protein